MDKVIIKTADTVKYDSGDDNLIVIMRIDTDEDGHYYQVYAYNTDTDKAYEKFAFRVEEKYMDNPDDSLARQDAEEKYQEIYKEF